MIFAVVVGVIVAILFLAISFSFLGKEANKIVEKKSNHDKKYQYGSASSGNVGGYTSTSYSANYRGHK